MQGQQLFGVGQLLRGDQLEVDMGKDRKEKGLQLVAVNFQRVVDVVGKLLEIHLLGNLWTMLRALSVTGRSKLLPITGSMRW